MRPPRPKCTTAGQRARWCIALRFCTLPNKHAMTTLAESLISSTSRPLTLRMRPDLSARMHRYHGRTFWVVKEPVGLNYFRFHEEEFAILGMLDGMTSLDDIKEQFEVQFAPQKITYHDLLQFV